MRSSRASETRARPAFGQFFSRELGEVLLRKEDAKLDVPSSFPQARARHESIAAIVAFAAENNRPARPPEKFLDGGSDSRPGAIHQRFDLHPPGKGGFLRGPHGRGAHDGRVQSVLRALLFTALLLLRFGALALAALMGARFRRASRIRSLGRHLHEVVAQRETLQ